MTHPLSTGAFRLALLFSVLVLFSTQARSQQTNPDGYYITLKQDTVTGTFPHYHETARNPASIVFLPKGSTQEIKLTPGSCIVISVSQSDRFLSYHGKRLTNPTSALEDLGDQPDVYEDANVFLRELYNDGRYQLYELSGEKRDNFYISGDTLQLQELYYKAYREGGEAMGSHKYQQQLSLLFSDKIIANSGIRVQLERTPYGETQLLKFFEKAAGGKDLRPRKKYPAKAFIGLGASLNLFNVEGSANNIPYGSYSTNVSPLVQFGAHVPVGRGGAKLYLTFTLQGYAFKNYAFDQYRGADTFKAVVINVPITIGYRLISGPKVALGLSAGFAPNFLLNNKQVGEYTYANSAFQVDNGTSFAFSGVAGAELFLGQKISFALNYSLPCRVGPFLYYKPIHSALQFGLRYSL